MKVLLFANDIMPFGSLPTSGGGLRCFQLMRGLEHHGIEVVASMPGFTYLADKYYDRIPPEQKSLLWKHETQDDLIRSVKPDAVLYASNWDHFALLKKPNVPLIVDLHGSRLIETTMFDRPVSTERKVSVFSMADCFLTAGTRQQNYFYGWLVQAGRVPDAEHIINYIPVSLSPELPEHCGLSPLDNDFPMFVSGGGWFPWQNQSKALFAVCDEVAKRDKGMVRIFGTPHAENAAGDDERAIVELYKRVVALSEKSKRITISGYVGRDELLPHYSRASVALEAMQYNLERELAFTTRTVEYLWCGMPVIYNNFGELSTHIKDYDAGWCVDANSELSVRQAIDEIFSNADLVKQKSKNAQRLVQDRLTWDKTIMPLIEFLKSPKIRQQSDPVLGLVYTMPSYLQAKGETFDIELTKSNLSASQRCIVPAENICGLEIPIALPTAKANAWIDNVKVTLSSANNKRISQTSIKGSAIAPNGSIQVRFPFWRTPLGGEILIVRVDAQLTQSANSELKPLDTVLRIRAVQHAKFPLQSSDNMSNSKDNKLIALSFLPAEYSFVYKLQMHASRAIYMIRQGQWRRLARAARRRIPQVIAKLKLTTK